jgi:glutamate/tyrosine decarboxylase-like PLP-dependent enzyme
MGRSGIADLIDRCCAHAQSLSKGLNDLGYEILNDVVMNQVVATIGSDQNIDDITRMVQEEGVCWFGKTVWNDKAAIRLSVASWVTNKDDIVKTLESIKRATKFVMSEVNVLGTVDNENPITDAGKFG